VIPWHFGTIIDDIAIDRDSDDTLYWDLEGEANRFAAELLMPSEWVRSIRQEHDSPCDILEHIRIGADVSFDAALIRLNSVLPPGYLYGVLNEDGVVISAGRSVGTLAGRPERGTLLNFDTAFPASAKRWSMPLRGGICGWWYFPREMTLPAADETLSWRELLNEILTDLELDEEISKKIKQSVNAIVSYANSMMSNDLRVNKLAKTAEAIFSASMQRFDSYSKNDPIISEVAAHKLFPIYLALRAKQLALGRRTR